MNTSEKSLILQAAHMFLPFGLRLYEIGGGGGGGGGGVIFGHLVIFLPSICFFCSRNTKRSILLFKLFTMQL